MKKVEYVAEILGEMLSEYAVTGSQLQEWSKEIVDGLDMWHETSGDSIASTNRYQYLESEKREAVKKMEKEMEQEQRKHKEEVEEIQRRIRYMRSQHQQEVEALKKQIK